MDPQPPVVTQPLTTTYVQMQTANPLFPRGAPREWNTGLCECFNDVPVCLLGLFCGPCHQCCIATDIGENCCVPICVPGSMIAMRSLVRGRHNIQGSIMNDCCITQCIPCLGQCQLAREVNGIKAGKIQP